MDSLGAARALGSACSCPGPMKVRNGETDTIKSAQFLTGVFCNAMPTLTLIDCAPSTPASHQMVSAAEPPIWEPVECTPLPPASNEAVSTAESLVQAYISAWNSRDAEKYLSLHSSDAITADHRHGSEYVLERSKTAIRAMLAGILETTADTYSVSSDGSFATLLCTTTDVIKDGTAATGPAATILEFQYGTIVKEHVLPRQHRPPAI